MSVLNPITAVEDFIPSPEVERQGLTHDEACAVREKKGGEFNELEGK